MVCDNCKDDVSTVFIEEGKRYCEDCKRYMPSYRQQTGTMVVNSDQYINGTYEHIASHPIKITGGKKELKAVCEKHGVMAKSLLKPKSRGRGYEMR